ncbi:MAG: DUF2591 domain-containing protein [Alcaligenaceae bacterium]|nr:MAG: DUF2591 domain-containing protein [Alcaligenaceae bacterium]
MKSHECAGIDMKTSELMGLMLDFWLAKALAKTPARFNRDGDAWVCCVGDGARNSASSWAVVGPILNQHIKALIDEGNGIWEASWSGQKETGRSCTGPVP